MIRLVRLTMAALVASAPAALADGFYNIYGEYGDKWGEISFQSTQGDDAVWLWPNEEGETVFFIDNPAASRGDWSQGTYDGYYVVELPDHIATPCRFPIADAFGQTYEEWGTARMNWTGSDAFRVQMSPCGGAAVALEFFAQFGTGPSDYEPVVPVSVELFLQSYQIPLSYEDPAYTEQGLDKNPSVNLNVTFSDGSTQGNDYLKYYADNIVFDDVSGDPNDIIEIVPWPVDPNDASLGTFAGQLTSTGNGVGTAQLMVSFRDAPDVTGVVTVEVVSAAQQFDAPVSTNLALGAYKLAVNRRAQAHRVSQLNMEQPIYVTALFEDGSTYDFFYHRDFVDNVVIDAVSGDPRNLIEIVEFPVDNNRPRGAQHAGQVISTGRGTGTASLLLSFRNAPGVTASVAVHVVSARQ